VVDSYSRIGFFVFFVLTDFVFFSEKDHKMVEIFNYVFVLDNFLSTQSPADAASGFRSDHYSIKGGRYYFAMLLVGTTQGSIGYKSFLFVHYIYWVLISKIGYICVGFIFLNFRHGVCSGWMREISLHLFSLKDKFKVRLYLRLASGMRTDKDLFVGLYFEDISKEIRQIHEDPIVIFGTLILRSSFFILDCFCLLKKILYMKKVLFCMFVL